MLPKIKLPKLPSLEKKEDEKDYIIILGKKKPRIPKSEYRVDENSEMITPSLALPDLDDGNLEDEIEKYL